MNSFIVSYILGNDIIQISDPKFANFERMAPESSFIKTLEEIKTEPKMAPRTGLEPVTKRLTVSCSTN